MRARAPTSRSPTCPKSTLAYLPEEQSDAQATCDVVESLGRRCVMLAGDVTAAATLHPAGITDVDSSAKAAEALRPVAGPFAFAIFTLGIIGTGLLAVPVLAGSAAYALGEANKWTIGLARKAREAKAFYASIAFATMLGALLSLSPINPIKALYWAAVLNGVVAVPLMVTMMLMTRDTRIMGRFVVAGPLRVMGWAATLLMAASVAAMAVTAVA